LVIVPVSAFQVEDAVRELLPLVGGNAVFLILSSNWSGTGALEALLSQERCLLGYADAGGTIRNGVYWTNLGAEIHLGSMGEAGRSALKRVASLFAAADMHPDLPNSILHWLWVHNASVVGFAVPFGDVGDFQSLLGNCQLLTRCLQATRELLSLSAARGVKVGDFPDVAYLRWMPFWVVIPLMRRMFRKNESMQRYTAHAASPGALKESLFHYEAMLKTADELAVAVPVLRALKGAPGPGAVACARG
jgi:ketopantoate reductase